jgi:hypothetical protein
MGYLMEGMAIGSDQTKDGSLRPGHSGPGLVAPPGIFVKEVLFPPLPDQQHKVHKDDQTYSCDKQEIHAKK